LLNKAYLKKWPWQILYRWQDGINSFHRYRN
jgi:hypothetical protein